MKIEIHEPTKRYGLYPIWMGATHFVELALYAFAPEVDVTKDITATYWITDMVNNKHYVGSSEEVQKRAEYHKDACTDSLLHEAIRTHGFEKFSYEILRIGTLNECRAFERELRGFYNLTNARYGYCGNQQLNPKPKHFRPKRAVKWGLPVEVDGITYESNREAAIALDLHDSQVKKYKARMEEMNRIRSQMKDQNILKINDLII